MPTWALNELVVHNTLQSCVGSVGHSPESERKPKVAPRRQKRGTLATRTLWFNSGHLEIHLWNTGSSFFEPQSSIPEGFQIFHNIREGHVPIRRLYLCHLESKYPRRSRRKDVIQIAIIRSVRVRLVWFEALVGCRVKDVAQTGYQKCCHPAKLNARVAIIRKFVPAFRAYVGPRVWGRSMRFQRPGIPVSVQLLRISSLARV